GMLRASEALSGACAVKRWACKCSVPNLLGIAAFPVLSAIRNGPVFLPEQFASKISASRRRLLLMRAFKMHRGWLECALLLDLSYLVQSACTSLRAVRWEILPSML